MVLIMENKQESQPQINQQHRPSVVSSIAPEDPEDRVNCSDFCEWLAQCLLSTERENQMIDYIAENEEIKEEETKIDEENVQNDEPKVTEDRVEPSFGDGSAITFKRERFKQLYNKHGYNLAIYPGGHVGGVRAAFNLYAVLEIIPVEVGEVRIRGVETGLFLAMREDGKLYATANLPDNNDDASVFVESVQDNLYLTYLNKMYASQGWYLGVTKKGNAKNGKWTWYPWGQKAILFAHRRPYLKIHPLKQLVNRHGFHLSILNDGKVLGVKEDFDKNSVLEFNPSNPPGAYRIRGVESDLYLAMDNKGRVYGEKDRFSGNTLWSEHSYGDNFFIYLSVQQAHLGWHLGIKRSGIAKKGRKTVVPAGQKAVQFYHKLPYPSPPTEIDLSKALGDRSPPLRFIDEDQPITENLI